MLHPNITQWDLFPLYFIVGFIMKFLSSFFCIFVVMSYVIFPKLRYLFLVHWMSISTIGNALSLLFGMPKDGSDACYAQGFISQFFSLSEVLSIALSVREMSILVDANHSNHRKSSKPTYFSFGVVWGGAFVSSLIPLMAGHSLEDKTWRASLNKYSLYRLSWTQFG